MRLLLDESLPIDLADLIVGHEVVTDDALGWKGVKNGELLRRAAGGGIDAFITPDRSLEFQQNLSSLPLAVVVLRARRNRMEELEPLVPELIRTLASVQPRQLYHVEGDGSQG